MLSTAATGSESAAMEATAATATSATAYNRRWGWERMFQYLRCGFLAVNVKPRYEGITGCQLMAACPRFRMVSGFPTMVKQNFEDLTLTTLECAYS